MSNAQQSFNKATDPLDRAYWQGAIDGEANATDSIIRLITNEIVFAQAGARNWWADTPKKNKFIIAVLLGIIGKIKRDNK